MSHPKDICEAVLMERKINKQIDSSFLRSDYMITTIVEARKFWSDKEREERKKKKHHVIVAWKQDDGKIKFF